MNEPRPFHHLFGLTWIDFFRDSSMTVAEDTDLSHKQQFIDVVLVRQSSGPMPRPLPDGFEDLANHNLVTFKSYREALDGWALCELVGHYVNYRKQTSPSMQYLLPETDLRLFAVCARYPQNLASAGLLVPVREGVFDVRVLHLSIRLIVIHQLPQQDQNAMLLLFSAREELLRFAAAHYQPHSQETSTLLLRLLQAYREDPEMANKLDEFVRETIDELLKELPLSKRLEGLSPEERLGGLSPEERLGGLSPEERVTGLSPDEQRRAMEALQRQMKSNGPTTKPE
ncbi:MAG: hypothetical protein K2R98_32465 [Gemmataceae bacterium]|nr:hypothetical protein [Gemmataceae bacterium]